MNSNQFNDPKDKKDEQLNENRVESSQADEVYVYNADGSPMDTSDRTYISTELPEDGEEANDHE